MSFHIEPTGAAPACADRTTGTFARVTGRSMLPVMHASAERLILVTSLFWALTGNRTFLATVLADRDLAAPPTWGFAAAMVAMVVSLHVLLLALAPGRRTVKPLLAAGTLLSAIASYYEHAYGVVLDPSMVRNVLHSDVAEAAELVSTDLALHLALFAGLPLAALWHVRVVSRPWRRGVAVRVGMIFLAAGTLALSVLPVFQTFASFMRTHPGARYLVTPANALWSTAVAAAADLRGGAVARQAIGLDAAPGPSWPARDRPLVVVLVVGETARAANWGLNGYVRQTTPELERLQVVNLTNVTACGTSTEVSLPCMFAPIGRRRYDEQRIRREESLLHVVARAGVQVHWRDNQSGCKGVCTGLSQEIVLPASAPAACSGGRCLDEALASGLDERLASARGTHLWVLHMLGSHGPSYFRRYPPAFARFLPDCRHDDLQRCTVAEIVNAYDNSILYTDHVLAGLIARLRAHADAVDTALIYVSDHGESLGEHGLFLHGVPYPISPAEQRRVPMIFWASEGFERGAGLARGCLASDLRRRAAVAHDHLFHTVLSLLDVRTALHEPEWDLAARCRIADAERSL